MVNLEIMTTEKSRQVIEDVKRYLIPIIVVIFGLGVTWSTLNAQITTNAEAVEEIDDRCLATEQITQEILQRLASIDTKLEFIIGELERT
jgi:hypothetical protein